MKLQELIVDLNVTFFLKIMTIDVVLLVVDSLAEVISRI